MPRFTHDTIVPSERSALNKKQQVAEMFNNIAFRYDFLNRFLSFGIDVRWRKKAIRKLSSLRPQKILDVATGTGDMALMECALLHPQKIVGIDISKQMLAIGSQKIARAKHTDTITLFEEDIETTKFSDNAFDAVTVAFGVRNFANLMRGMEQMYRVLRPGGKAVILEFSKPNKTAFAFFYHFSMRTIVPSFGRLFANNKAAYKYLNDSILAFPEGQTFLTLMTEIGFKNTSLETLTMGVCTIYCGEK